MRTLVIAIAVLASSPSFAQPAAFARGESVRVGPASAGSRAPLTLTIVAVPGDRIRVDASRIYVNDVAVSGFSSDFVMRVAGHPRAPEIVPAGHYYVMGEQRVNADISEYWGVHAATSLDRVK